MGAGDWLVTTLRCHHLRPGQCTQYVIHLDDATDMQVCPACWVFVRRAKTDINYLWQKYGVQKESA
jgi:hypothetical protein